MFYSSFNWYQKNIGSSFWEEYDWHGTSISFNSSGAFFLLGFLCLGFIRHYSRDRCCFLFLHLMICLSSVRSHTSSSDVQLDLNQSNQLSGSHTQTSRYPWMKKSSICMDVHRNVHQTPCLRSLRFIIQCWYQWPVWKKQWSISNDTLHWRSDYFYSRNAHPLGTYCIVRA